MSSSSSSSAPPSPPPPTATPQRTNGVSAFGWDRWSKANAATEWFAATWHDMKKFWIIMMVLINPDMRHLLSHKKKGFHRTAADGIKSFVIALPMLVARLKAYGYYEDRDPTAQELYTFMHDYVNIHMSPAEFNKFFGEGSCAYGGAYVMAMFDALVYGISAAESVKRTYVDIGDRYVKQATVNKSLKERLGGGSVRISLTGGLLDVNDIPADKRWIWFKVDGTYDVMEDNTAKLFLSLAFEKVHAIACPLSRVSRELHADMHVQRCSASGDWHIKSDTFFGLRIVIDAPSMWIGKPPPLHASAQGADALNRSLLSQLYAQTPKTLAAAERVHALERTF